MIPLAALSDADVQLITAMPEYRNLRARRVAFLLPASIFTVCSFLSLPLSILVAPVAMSAPVLGPLTPVFLLALSLIATSLLLLAISIRVANECDLRAAELLRHIRKQVR